MSFLKNKTVGANPDKTRIPRRIAFKRSMLNSSLLLIGDVAQMSFESYKDDEEYSKMGYQ